MNISPAVKIKLLLRFTTATITPLHLHLIQIEQAFLTDTALRAQRAWDELYTLHEFEQKPPGLGLPDAFCKNTGHFVNNVISTVICVVIRKRHRENRESMSIVKPQLISSPGSLHFGVCVTCQSHQELPQQQQINFPEGTVLTRFTTRVITMREIRRLFFSKLRQIIYFQNTGFEHWLSKYRPLLN